MNRKDYMHVIKLIKSAQKDGTIELLEDDSEDEKLLKFPVISFIGEFYKVTFNFRKDDRVVVTANFIDIDVLPIQRWQHSLEHLLWNRKFLSDHLRDQRILKATNHFLLGTINQRVELDSREDVFCSPNYHIRNRFYVSEKCGMMLLKNYVSK